MTDVDFRQVTRDYLALVVAKANLAIETLEREGPTHRLATETYEVMRCAKQADLYAERAMNRAQRAATTLAKLA